MKTEQEYKQRVIAITDEGPLGFDEGTYVVSQSISGWSVFFAEGPHVIHGRSGLIPIQTQSGALAVAMEIINQDIADLANMKNAELKFHNHIVEPISTSGFELSVRSDNVKMAVSLSLLIDMHNVISQGHELRLQIKAAMRDASGSTGGIAGVIVCANDELQFDVARATANVHIRKQERYAKSFLEHLEKARSDLEFVSGARAEQLKMLFRDQDSNDPLVELTKASNAVLAFTSENHPVLSVLSSDASENKL